MPKATLFEAGTIGVDLKTNPLFLGKKKLHAATNLVFEEGVLKTRPGFRYLPLGCTGIFQGACEFHPKRGLSTASFSEIEGGVVVAVGGKLYFNCGLVKGVEFPCHGNVNLFQAENYLIIQHAESETYWWDGVNSPVKSPGMNEQDFNNPETPFVELETVAPVGDVPECVITPFNIHGFLTVPQGAYALQSFFGPTIVPAGNAYRTRWRLHTDTCGYNIEYFVGYLNNRGQLLVTGEGEGSSAYFDILTKEFVSTYLYPEGIYLQLGVVVDGTVVWPEASPCIAGGNQTP